MTKKDEILETIVSQVAHSKWEKNYGYGFNRYPDSVREHYFNDARAEVQRWFALLAPAFEADQSDSNVTSEKPIADKIEEAYEHIDDNWGSSGWAAAEYLKKIL